MKKDRNAPLDAFSKLGMIAARAQYRGCRLACPASRDGTQPPFKRFRASLAENKMLAFIKMKSQKVTGLRSLRDLRSREYARQCIIVAIVGLILVHRFLGTDHLRRIHVIHGGLYPGL
jgi:hypothetical protein